MRNKKLEMKRVGAYLMLALAVAQAILVLMSWLITAAMPEAFPRSLLSSEGIRWFFGSFTSNLATPWLVWILLASIAWGALQGSGLLRYDHTVYRQRNAIRLVAIELLAFLIVILLLTMVPHAILLNVMGGIGSSSFSRSILPYVCFAITTMSLSFGMMSESLKTIESVGECLSDGIRQSAPLFVIYLLIVQLYSSVYYLFA